MKIIIIWWWWWWWWWWWLNLFLTTDSVVGFVFVEFCGTSLCIMLKRKGIDVKDLPL